MVLVVEDEEMVLHVIRIFLSLEGFGVVAAEAEDEAVALADGFPGRIDLLLADIGLPKGSGPGVARRIRGAHPETKVAFMSGYSRAELIAQGKIQKDDVFIPKPFEVKTFRSTLRRLVLERHSSS